MQVWYIPTWNGDLRMETHPENKKLTQLSIIKPTPAELEVLKEIKKLAIEKGWICESDWPKDLKKGKNKKISLASPLDICGPDIAKLMQGGKSSLTAISLKNGKIEVTETKNSIKLKKLIQKLKNEGKKDPNKKPESATTVKRHTPCCPVCMEGAIEPATEALLSFLNEKEHEMWAKDRRIVVTGGITGHQYSLAHRKSKIAAAHGKICFDLTDGGKLHFHDSSVPPEEEILAAKLILEHREHWLRNEATCLGGGLTHVLKNPFAGGMDGVPDSAFTQTMGMTFKALNDIHKEKNQNN